MRRQRCSFPHRESCSPSDACRRPTSTRLHSLKSLACRLKCDCDSRFSFPLGRCRSQSASLQKRYASTASPMPNASEKGFVNHSSWISASGKYRSGAVPQPPLLLFPSQTCHHADEWYDAPILTCVGTSNGVIQCRKSPFSPNCG